MLDDIADFFGRFATHGIVAGLFSIAGFILAFFLVARLMSEKRAPANTFAWLLVIVFLPWFGVPLYLLIGGRKLRRLARRKSRVRPALPAAVPFPPACADSPVAHTIVAAGAAAPVAGNAIRFITTGEEAFDELANHIRSARHTIHITTFILSRDETGRKIVELLTARAKEGVRVRLLLDAVGSLFVRRFFTAELRHAGGEVGWFMPMLPFTSRGSANLRSHRKIAIFDHTTAIIGGHNLAKEYMGAKPWPKRWQDFGAVIEGPAAALLNEVFIADWCFATRASAEALHREITGSVTDPRGHAELQVVASGPDVPGDPLYEGIIAMIQEAEHSIWIVTPYFIPDDVLLRSLIVKARAGKDVTLILPAKSNHPVTDFARRHYIRELYRAGGHILLFGHGMAHSKAIIVDNRVGLVGSANFDLRSLFVNFEIGVVVHTAADVRAMKTWAQSVAQRCHEYKGERRKHGRIVSDIIEDLSRLLAPLL